MRRAVLALALFGLAACGGGADHTTAASATPTGTAAPAQAPQRARASSARNDWPRFGYDAARTSHAPRGIPAAKVGNLRERRVSLPGTATARRSTSPA
jgi:hypothetical protein